MYGIAGVYPGAAQLEVERMLDSLQHRGPDGFGVTETLGTTLGHTWRESRLCGWRGAVGRVPHRSQNLWVMFPLLS